ncbi:MAG: 50S ribosomal protein L29 [Candidatus Saccharimonadales bacterium]
MTEKTTKKAVTVKKELTLAEQVATKRTELFDMMRSLAAGELVNPRVITATRKDIARLLTAIRAEELAAKESK